MDNLRLLVWLAITAVVMMRVSCQDDAREGPTEENKGCVIGLSQDCGEINGQKFTCQQILQDATKGGDECPPQIEPESTGPARLSHPCTVGPWAACGPLAGFPNIMIRRRSPIDLTADLTTCPPLVELCGGGPQPIDCIMTPWSVWYYFGNDDEVKVRVRFILIPPQNGGAPCPHNIEACFYGPWSAWISFPGGCYRSRTAQSAFPSTTVCSTEFQTKPAPCQGCPIWGNWGNWVHVQSSSPCRQQRSRTCLVSPFNTETQTRICMCTWWGQWGAWTHIASNPCKQERTRTCQHFPFTTERQTRLCSCTSWGQWGAWTHIQSSSPCRQERSRTCQHFPFTTETQTRLCSCTSWGMWGAWTHIVNSNPCRDRRSRTCHHFPFVTQTQTRWCGPPCPPVGPWSAWMLSNVNPCRQTRRRDGPPCPPGFQTQTRPCIASCPPSPPPITVSGVLEAASAGGRRKRDVPWCPEQTWIIYGRSPGCVAVNNATWYRCIEMHCQNCIPPPSTGLVCIPNKFTTLVIPLICAGGVPDTMTLVRPQACTCFQVTNTCSKFQGPCGFSG